MTRIQARQGSADEHPSDNLNELTAAAAAAAIKDGSLTAQNYAAALLLRSRKQADLNAFITLDVDAVLEAAAKADQHRKSGKSMGPLHGVPIGIKDSMCTSDMPTSIGTEVLAGFRPNKDAAVVAALRAAGAVLFGKNNLVEMSYGLTGVNEHHGQAKNPYDKGRVTGGSSSGAGASVGGRLVPAALGGDTVGSIRIPASLCGVVGFRPTTGRWPGVGIAPISHTFDTPGPIARSVEDCALLDAIVTSSWLPSVSKLAGSLKGVRFGLAPRQFLDLIDTDVERTFFETIDKLKAAGVEFVELDLGKDFATLAEQANWPVFFHETMPHVTEFLRETGAPVTFRDVFEGLGSNLKGLWGDAVVPEGSEYVSETAYRESLDVHRPALRKRYDDAFSSNGIEALLYPTVPLVAPPLDTGAEVIVAGRTVSSINLAKNVFPSSCAALPGITMPMGLSYHGLPIGLELDGRPGEDVKLLDLAAQVSAVLGPIPPPSRV
jgi:Asp-tRNA(Asn)/Glu-tRNA(Gln) amidotransferase A subunit family amidase